MRPAVEELYEVFARYPLRPVIEGCPHCVSPEAQASLRSAPLQRLNAEALWPFALKVLNTWGDLDDLRHFLPRLLEVGEHDAVAAKLRQAAWRTWPEDERRAVERYFDALWQDVLARSPEERSAVGVLQTLGTVFDDLGPFLGEWESRSDDTALWQLAEAVTDLIETAPAAWDPRLADWLLSARTSELVEVGFFQAGSPSVAEALSEAHDNLALVRAANGRP